MHKFIDIHSHINLSPLWEAREEVIVRMREKGVATITVGTDLEISKRAIQSAEEFPDVILGATVGLHPNDNESEIFNMDAYRELTGHPKVVAIGETGLDYFRGKTEAIQKRQREIFIEHCKLAQELGKPLMIHARPSKGAMDSYEEVLNILKDFPDVKANYHFFVGDVAIAKKIVKRGDTVSLDGPITFSSEYDEVIKYLPIESIMCETDAPFAAPAPYRGKTCEPWMVEEMYKKIAEIKNLPPEVTRQQIINNSLNFLSRKIN